MKKQPDEFLKENSTSAELAEMSKVQEFSGVKSCVCSHSVGAFARTSGQTPDQKDIKAYYMAKVSVLASKL